MRKPWCGFFGRAHVIDAEFSSSWRAVTRYLILLFAVGLLTGGPRWFPIVFAEDSAAESDVLSLPALDVETVIPTPSGQQLRVGDRLFLKIGPISVTQTQEAVSSLSLELPPSSSRLEDQGWVIQPLEQVKSDVLGAKLKVPATLGKRDYAFFAIPVKAGTLTLPSLILKDSTGKQIARTNPLSVTIESAIPKDDPRPSQPEEVEPPVGLKYPLWVVVAEGLIAFGVFCVLCFFFYRWWKKRKERLALAMEPARSEDEMALLRLSELERQGLCKQLKFKAHYFGVSEILKSYVGARYGFDALESTTGEMIAVLRGQKLATDAAIEALSTLFEKLDRVKFTDHVPELDESVMLLTEAQAFIRATRRNQREVTAHAS